MIIQTLTPVNWFEVASKHLPTLLLDHAWCERKAAQTALSLLNKTNDPRIQRMLSKIVREEMRHFEMLLPWLKKYNVTWAFLSPPRYGQSLIANRSKHQDVKLLDTLVIASIIEARSCERFAGLAKILPADISAFYRKLMLAEARHVNEYLDMACLWGFSTSLITERLDIQSQFESEILREEESVLRFHSGQPDKSLTMS